MAQVPQYAITVCQKEQKTDFSGNTKLKGRRHTLFFSSDSCLKNLENICLLHFEQL